MDTIYTCICNAQHTVVVQASDTEKKRLMHGIDLLPQERTRIMIHPDLHYSPGWKAVRDVNVGFVSRRLKNYVRTPRKMSVGSTCLNRCLRHAISHIRTNGRVFFTHA